MTSQDLSWTADARQISGPGFDRFQIELSKYNGDQLRPRLPDQAWRDELDTYARVMRAEGEYIEACRPGPGRTPRRRRRHRPSTAWGR